MIILLCAVVFRSEEHTAKKRGWWPRFFWLRPRALLAAPLLLLVGCALAATTGAGGGGGGLRGGRPAARLVGGARVLPPRRHAWLAYGWLGRARGRRALLFLFIIQAALPLVQYYHHCLRGRPGGGERAGGRPRRPARTTAYHEGAVPLACCLKLDYVMLQGWSKIYHCCQYIVGENPINK